MSVTGFGSTQPRDGQDRVRFDDLVDVLKLKNGEWENLRLVGPIYSVYEFWIKIKTKSGKIVAIRKLCLDWDHDKQSFVSENCPYRKAGLKGRKLYYTNAIVRRIQEEEPAKKAKPTKYESKKKHVVATEEQKYFLKEKGSKSWTPVRVLRTPATLAEKFKNLMDINRKTDKETGEVRKYELSHTKYGIDVLVRMDTPKTGPVTYDAQKGERTPLTEDELDYLLYKLDVEHPETLEKAKQEWANLKGKLADSEEEADDDDDKPKKKKSYLEDVDDDDDDEDEKPKKKKKKKSSEDDDDDDDSFDSDDLDDIDDDDDDKPKKKKKKKGWK